MIKTEDELNKNGSRMKGKIIFFDDISLKMITESKMCFETSLRINTNSIYQVELMNNNNNEKRKLTGEAISSLLKRVKKENGDNTPIYEVYINFTELNNIERQFLNKLKNEHENQNRINLSNIIVPNSKLLLK
jgi:hypothetical protein